MFRHGAQREGEGGEIGVAEQTPRMAIKLTSQVPSSAAFHHGKRDPIMVGLPLFVTEPSWSKMLNIQADPVLREG